MFGNLGVRGGEYFQLKITKIYKTYKIDVFVWKFEANAKSLLEKELKMENKQNKPKNFFLKFQYF